MPQQYRLFVGIDWATEFHEACVLDGERRLIDRRKVEHCGAGIAQFGEVLLKLSGNEPEQVAVAIETPRRSIVETLVERSFSVHSLNPKQMDRFRDRHTVAAARDDSRDAFVMADGLRTNLHLFRRVGLDDALIVRVRELSRTEEDVQQAIVRATHQVRELPIRYYPQMLKLSPGLDEPWHWALLEMAPLPAQVASLKRNRVERLLKEHRIRRLSADEVLTALRVQPLRLAPGAAEAASEHALLQLPLLRVLKQQRDRLPGESGSCWKK